MGTFLYQDYDSLSRLGGLDKTIPDFLKNNLNQKFSLRNYQIEAFARFFHYYKSYPDKSYPIHLLFNMATGSGKTLIMAGLILALYKEGYRNFIFFVNTNTIINKTKANFIDKSSSKYLFNQKIVIDDKIININEVENFSNEDNGDINIKFTTVQGLHSDLNKPKENNITYEDFENKKIVLLSDEAHHINADTKKKKTKEELENSVSRESTIMKVFNSNKDNYLFEFTATINLEDQGIHDKYINKLLYKYDLKEFRLDGYSKEIDILKSDMDQSKTILQAVILSQYRLKIAQRYSISCKPVILFKAQNTISESENNMVEFVNLIRNLKKEQIEEIELLSKDTILENAFNFFKENNISFDSLVDELKEDFSADKCISANDDSDLEMNQMLLNTLEDRNNNLRAIFAVEKLNEGWDVLNLFDIVRLYKSRSNVLDKKTGKSKPGPQTVSEAQLIGRGARYFPFSIDEEDKFKRKYDNSDHELKILETFIYHTRDENSYISEIKQALRDIGIIEENEKKPFKLSLKKEFIESDFYKNGYIYVNDKKQKPIDNLSEKLEIKNKRKDRQLANNTNKLIVAFGSDLEESKIEQEVKSIKIGEIQPSVIRKALWRNSFFEFSNIKKYISFLDSINTFINTYLKDIYIDFKGSKERIQNITQDDKLEAISSILKEVENNIRNLEYDYEGTTEFNPISLKTIFSPEKIISVTDGVNEITNDNDWFVFEKIKGTSEEEEFINFFGKKVEDLKEKYSEIYLLRSERTFALYSFNGGKRFEPDFVLFLRDKDSNETCTFQVFIEPKGNQFKDDNGGFEKSKEGRKQDFLLDIEEKHSIIDFNFGNFKLIGLPFYNKDLEDKFEEVIDKKLIN